MDFIRRNTTGLNYFFILIVICYVLYHYLTLVYSPIPWYDEVAFSSISLSYSENKTFYSDAVPALYGYKETKIYGPVYFVMQSWIIKVFGFDIFQMRVLNLTAGLLLLTLFFWYCRSRLHFSFYKAALVIVLAGTEMVFIQNLHSGRMDLLATLFLVIGTIALLELGNRLNVVLALLSGIFISLAMLTTARAGLIFAFVPVVLLASIFWNFQLQRFINYSLVAFAIVLSYGSWIVIGFGGLHEFIEESTSVSNLYVGSSIDYFFKNPFQILTYLTLLGFFLIGLFTRKISLSSWVWFSMFLAFKVLVVELGPYSAMAMLFAYLLIIELKPESGLGNYAVTALVFINVSLFLAKSIVVVTSLNQRSPYPIDSIVAHTIPQESKVVGDYPYYYALVKNKCEFRGLDWFDPEVETSFHPDFIILNTSDHKTLDSKFIKNYKIEKVRVPTLLKDPLYERILQIFKINANLGYSPIIYKVVK